MIPFIASFLTPKQKNEIEIDQNQIELYKDERFQLIITKRIVKQKGFRSMLLPK